MLSLTVHYIIDIIFSIFSCILYLYILFSVVHMSLVKQCIFLCTLRSICYVRINIIIIAVMASGGSLVISFVIILDDHILHTLFS